MYKDMVDDGDNPLEADTDSMMSAGQVGITVGGPWVTAGLDTAGVDYGIGLIPQGDAGDMNSVEVIGFGITTAASDAEKKLLINSSSGGIPRIKMEAVLL